MTELRHSNFRISGWKSLSQISIMPLHLTVYLRMTKVLICAFLQTLGALPQSHCHTLLNLTCGRHKERAQSAAMDDMYITSISETKMKHITTYYTGLVIYFSAMIVFHQQVEYEYK